VSTLNDKETTARDMSELKIKTIKKLGNGAGESKVLKSKVKTNYFV
jgi:hypothetical protein